MEELLVERISINPNIMTGKPVIRGTRIPAELIVRMLSQGISESEILKEYPHLELQDIRAALTYASQVLAHEEVFPVPGNYIVATERKLRIRSGDLW